MACCRATHVSRVGRLVQTVVVGAAGFTVVFVIAVSLVLARNARKRRERSAGGVMLPTTFGELAGSVGLGGPGGLMGGGARPRLGSGGGSGGFGAGAMGRPGGGFMGGGIGGGGGFGGPYGGPRGGGSSWQL